MKNFYPQQYKADEVFKINHNYLSEQFTDCDEILEKIKSIVKDNDFTLGSTVDEVEKLIAKEADTKNAIAVGSGTDALMLSLKALGVDKGDEVITTSYTFYATIGAIVTAGATPVFCDCREDYNIDYSKIIEKITPRTKVIMPVHWAGRACNMEKINEVATEHNLKVIEDACHALQGEYKNKRCGGLSDIGCFSFHPLKNLNVWGDGGIITTNSDILSEKLRLLRNHGLRNRDICEEFAYNSRLDTIQAVVAKHVLENKLENITKKRIENAHYYDLILKDILEIKTLERSKDIKEVFHLYLLQAKRRDMLAKHLQSNGVDAKVHYPVPMHLQPAARKYRYSKGDFPVSENLAENTISLPVHEFITNEQIEYTCNLIRDFYSKS